MSQSTTSRSIWLSLTLCVSLSLVALYGLVNSSKRITQLEQQLAEQRSHTVLALNGKKMIAQFQAAGADQALAFSAYGLLLKLLEDDGVLVIERHFTATHPDQDKFSRLTVQDVYDLATQRGVDIEQYQRSVIRQAQREAEKMIAELERATATQSGR
ncbi:hypothetical protein [Pseudoalteromonas rubra]|uniref:Uncharacterized protein n=1 Tax=Pseudoalteromonas rubra TaxID=43658 RepID=A0A0U3GSW9_9GAMM|nr:hypothetical protein [Pseudoalteromonas rubra]ALU46155.1 hypothetical protein AT705_24645 [Pseudoalteromonas rubra]